MTVAICHAAPTRVREGGVRSNAAAAYLLEGGKTNSRQRQLECAAQELKWRDDANAVAQVKCSENRSTALARLTASMQLVFFPLLSCER